jgi:hypothetical protein
MNELDKKREELLKKYSGGKFNLDNLKSYAVFRRPIGSIFLHEMEMVVTTDSHEESLEEIRWRAECSSTGNKDIAMKNDERFKTFYDDSQTGKKAEDYNSETLDYSGEYFILPIYRIE